MADCAKIAAGIALDCDNPLVPGVDEDVLIANKADIESVVRDGANKLLISSIVMTTGTQFFKFEGKNDSLEPNYSLVKSRYSDTFEHGVRFKVFDNEVATKLSLDQIAKGTFVALVKNNDGQWEIYGLDVGLKSAEMSRNPLDADTGGAHDVFIKTSDNLAKEPNLPATFFNTDAATTEAAITTLLAPAV